MLVGSSGRRPAGSGCWVDPGCARRVASVGALIESPAFYPHLSGVDNLRLAARYAGVPDSAADRVLAEVGLTDRARSPFRTYSLGMKQRLGVAAALLKEPSLLILDEPTNGLDPAGVSEIRELLRSLGQQGRTVLLSSHVLGEVEQVCDRIAVLNRAGWSPRARPTSCAPHSVAASCALPPTRPTRPPRACGTTGRPSRRVRRRHAAGQRGSGTRRRAQPHTGRGRHRRT
ncbi:ATP-binding cassette domain-containing protein [Micromonospora sp. M12]